MRNGYGQTNNTHNNGYNGYNGYGYMSEDEKRKLNREIDLANVKYRNELTRTKYNNNYNYYYITGSPIGYYNNYNPYPSIAASPCKISSRHV